MSRVRLSQLNTKADFLQTLHSCTHYARTSHQRVVVLASTSASLVATTLNRPHQTHCSFFCREPPRPCMRCQR